MAKRQRLTNSSDESEIAGLLSGDTIFSIPYFQRPYKWKVDRLKKLNEDILSLVDGVNDHHFLGAVIIHGRRSNPSDPDVYDVIDGQQRITTLLLLLLAVVRTLCIHGEYGEAARLFQKYLVIGLDTQALSNLKIHPCKDDRIQLNNIYKEILSDGSFREKLGGFIPKFLPASGEEKGTLKTNYNYALKFLAEQHQQEGIERVRQIYIAMLELVSVVQIDVLDPLSGPKIFDGLNSHQEPMTIGDLVRNEIFSRVANQAPDQVERIDHEAWQPFYKKFQSGGKNLFDGYFFPYGLIADPTLTKSAVYGALRERWKKTDSPEEIIKELATYQNAFLDIACGTNHQGHNPKIQARFMKLFEAGIPNSTYPFLIQLSKGCKDNAISESDAIDVLQTVESFLVRRAICGHEPTGLHAVFKGLWKDCGGTPTKESVTKGIRAHKTVPWPNDNEVQQAIKTRALYSSTITRFLLIEQNNSLKGDKPNINPWIEHVLPDNPSKEWFNSFTKQEHEKMKDLIANLIPLSQQMNQVLGNKEYAHKRDVYRTDSAFKISRNFAEQYSSWTPTEIAERGEAIAEWAIHRWSI